DANWIETVLPSPGKRTLEKPAGRYLFPGAATGGSASYLRCVCSSIMTAEASENGFKSSAGTSARFAPAGTRLPMPRKVPGGEDFVVAVTRTKTKRRLS